MIFACERPLRLVDVPDLPCRACVPAGASGGSSSRPKWCGTLKELKDGVALDRLSCSRFHANQFRLLLTTAAYILFQSLRLASRGTGVGDGTGHHAARTAAEDWRVARGGRVGLAQ